MKKSDKTLGMNCDITRRDFMNGVGVAVTGALVSNPVAAAVESAGQSSAQMSPDYYPPTLSGMITLLAPARFSLKSLFSLDALEIIFNFGFIPLAVSTI